MIIKMKDLLEKIKKEDVFFVSKKHGPAFTISYISSNEEDYLKPDGEEGYEISLNTKYPKLEKILRKLDKYNALGRDAELGMIIIVLSKKDCLSFIQSFKEEKWFYKNAKEVEQSNLNNCLEEEIETEL